MRWYWEVPFFDKFAHVISAIALGLILSTMYQYLDYLEYVRKRSFFKKRIRIFRTQEEDVLVGIFIILVVFGFAWEFSEYLIDIIYHTTNNFVLVDSITDFSGDIIGVLIVIYLGPRSMETIPPGEYLDYLLLEHTPSSRSVKYEALPIPDNPDFFQILKFFPGVSDGRLVGFSSCILQGNRASDDWTVVLTAIPRIIMLSIAIPLNTRK